jgi:hypothetical protein
MTAALTVREAGFVLQKTERQIRYLIDQGTLTRCNPGASVTPTSVAALLPNRGDFMGGTGLEPVTPSLSSWCSPN